MPRRFDQQPADGSGTLLADPPILGQPESGLPHPRIEAEVAHKLLWAGEPAHLALKVLIAEHAALAGLSLPDDGHFVARIGLQMLIEAALGDVERGPLEPARVG